MFLPYLSTSPSKDFNPPNEVLTIASNSTNPKKIFTSFDDKEADENKCEKLGLFKSPRILSLYQKLMNTRLDKILHNTSICRKMNTKHHRNVVLSRYHPFKKEHKNSSQTWSLEKKTAKHRICLDFRNINKPLINNIHPLPKTDHIIRELGVSNHVVLSDNFSGYHQIIPLQKD